MIKTFVNMDYKLADQDVNDFMTQRGRNMPVRTETFVLDGKAYHKYVVFFDENLGIKQSSEANAIAEEDAEATELKDDAPKKSGNLGAIWKNDDGKLGVKFKGEYVNFTPEVIAKIREVDLGEKLQLIIKGEKVTIIKSKFKKGPKDPTWVILPRKEE